MSSTADIQGVLGVSVPGVLHASGIFSSSTGLAKKLPSDSFCSLIVSGCIRLLVSFAVSISDFPSSAEFSFPVLVSSSVVLSKSELWVFHLM